jgi:hypothetical protein
MAKATGGVCVRIEDVSRADGWGPYVASGELRINDSLAASFRSGSEIETRFLSEDRGSVCDGNARFADRAAYWVYRFDGLPRDASIKLTLDMGNGFLVGAYPAPASSRVIERVSAPPDASGLPAWTDDPVLRRLRILDGYGITAYALPEGAKPLYRRADDGLPVVWHARAGNGSVLYAGVAPAFLTATAQTDRWVREMGRHMLAATGEAYRTTDAFVARRGPYVAARALARDADLDGTFVDLLSPTLTVVENPSVPAGSAAFFQQVNLGGRSPGILAVSGRLSARMETQAVTSFVARAPAATVGVARLASGGKTIAGVKAVTARGEPVAVSARPDAGGVVLRYENSPEGVAVRVAWK